ncbi:regulation of lateral pseudopodium assembly [Sparganum proliferum]
MFLFGLRLLFQILNWIDSADNEERPRVRQTFVGADKDPTIILFGEDRQRRWSVLRWNPHLQQAERVADMEAGRRWGASYSAVGGELPDSCLLPLGAGSWLLYAFLFFSATTKRKRAFSLLEEKVFDSKRRVDEFLVREGRWRERAPLAVGRWGHAAAVVKVPTAAAADGEETLIGVFGGWGPLPSCEVYEVRQDRWHTLPDLPEARTGPAAACLPGDSRVFVFGASVVFCHLRADWRSAAAGGDLSGLLAGGCPHENCAIRARSDGLSGSDSGRRWRG